MPQLVIHPSGPLRGSTAVPGDKSISHRALILGALADGDTHVSGWVSAEVCLATLRCIRALGVSIDLLAPVSDRTEGHGLETGPSQELLIHGVGLNGLREPADVLHCAGSGTTIRLLAGLLAGQPFTSVLTGADALRRRPMGRVTEPLRRMGATILGREGGKLAPLTLRGGDLHGIEYIMPVASAQVKSAILLAGLFAEGETIVHEPGPSRDHTERMLRQFGVEIASDSATVRLIGRQPLKAFGETLTVPGDFSSAAFPLVAAAIMPGSEVALRGIGVNPTRTGLYDLLAAMGAELRDEGPMTKDQEASSFVVRRSSAVGEPISNLVIRGSNLRGVEVGGDLVVRAIDEFPVFAVAATQATGTTTVRDAAELRVKESDRIASVATELRKMGAHVEERPDGMVIHGLTPLIGATVESHGDHRLAMALAVAGLVARGETVVRGAEALNDSFPGFVETMQALGADVAWAANGESANQRMANQRMANTQHAIRSTQYAVTGATRLTGVIGWPVSHSLSPPMHNAAFAALGLNWVYVPLPVAPERVEAAVRGLIALGFAGANVTVPHKSTVVPFMDELTPIAAAIGAVNTIVVRPDGTLLGDSTDGVGFMADLWEHGQRIEADKRMMPENPDVTPSPCHPVTLSPCHRVLVLGAGGAARALVYALAEAGATVAVVNRTLAHAAELCHTIGRALPQAKISAHSFPAALPELAVRADLIVNTTSLGLHKGDPLPWLPDLPFRADQVVYDLIYSRPTPLLTLAEQCGARAINGLGMLIHQGARSFELWTGQKAPIDVMMTAARGAEGTRRIEGWGRKWLP